MGAARVESLATTSTRPARPSFLGALGGEVLKLRRQGWIWAMLGIALLFFAVLSLAVLQVTEMRRTLEASPTLFLYNLYDIYLNVFDTGAGIFLLIVSARLVGMEYSGGTIRVLLGRGAGRLRLFLAKLTALVLLGLGLLAGYLVLVVATVYLSALSWGSASRFAAVPSHVWGDLVPSLLVSLASIGIAILIGSSASVIGRSVTFGLTAGLAFFPADNALTLLSNLLAGLTHQGVWKALTTFLLGPNLNVLPFVMETDRKVNVAFAVPLNAVSATHAWLVVAAWAAAILVACVVLLRRRDVLQ
jgi:ABC-type transport system involved in multi-copper enzyme maturation permease subunit